MTIGPATRLYAVLGRPVGHSRSPALHNRWFQDHQIDAVYVALEVPEGREAEVPSAVRALGLAGVNLTAPLKVVALRGLDHVEPDAVAAGAVNLVLWVDGRLVGANTDVAGFGRSLHEVAGDQRFGRAAIAGAGGAARAVAVFLARAGVKELVILGRRRSAVEALVEDLLPQVPSIRGAAIETSALAGAELFVDATSAHAGAVAALDAHALAPGAVWMNLNYWDLSPPGIEGAVRAGCRVGLGDRMLLWQAALSFERWTGVRSELLVGGRGARAEGAVD